MFAYNTPNYQITYLFANLFPITIFVLKDVYSSIYKVRKDTSTHIKILLTSNTGFSVMKRICSKHLNVRQRAETSREIPLVPNQLKRIRAFKTISRK